MPTAAAKLDLRKQHPEGYAATRAPALVDVGPGKYLAVAGKGKPGGPEFQQAVASLYSTAYTLKFQGKAAGRDFKVAPLEGIWEVNDEMGPEAFGRLPWRLLLRVPDRVAKADLRRASEALAAKGKAPPCPVTLERLDEGPCVQALHVGPYDKERDTVAALQSFARAHGYKPRGTHHEIYLSDPGRTPPGRLRTILRHPVKGGAGAAS